MAEESGVFLTEVASLVELWTTYTKGSGQREIWEEVAGYEGEDRGSAWGESSERAS